MTGAWWQTDWIWQATGWALAAIGAALLLWALFWDRSRGRRRCPKCWYDMAGVPASEREGRSVWVCPECGRVTKKERRQRKTRRRRWWAALGLLVFLVGASVSVIVQATRRGWWSLLSTNRVVDLMPLTGSEGLFARELMSRMGWNGSAWVQTTRLNDAEQVYLLDRIRHGSILAGPGSSRWLDTYGSIPHLNVQLVDLGFATHPRDDRFGPHHSPEVIQAITRLYDLPLHIELSTRRQWPKGTPLYLNASAVCSWPWPTGWSIEVVRKDTGERVFRGQTEGGLVRGVKEGSGVLDLEVSIYQLRQAEPGATSKLIDKRSFQVPYRIAGNLADVMSPVTNPAIDRLVGGMTYQVGDGWVSTQVDSTCVAATSGVAFGAILEHQLDGVTLYRERMWWMGGAGTILSRQSAEREWIGGTRNAWGAKPGEKWSIHIVSDAETALRVPNASKYWSGEATIDVSNQKTRADR